MPAERFRRRAFTALEVMIAIVIIGVLVSLSLPLLARMRGASRAAECLSNLRQVGLATYAIVAERDEVWPFWVSNLPASPPVKRESLSDVYAPHFKSLEVFRCPADPVGGRTRVADYTSYEYWPGAEMQGELHKGPDVAIREVSIRMNRARGGSWLWDRQQWHAGGKVEQACFAPDGHAGVK